MVAFVKPAAPKIIPDPMKAANAAIERLAHIVTATLQMPPPQLSIPTVEQQPRPIRLEASITRDTEGKMERVVITPVYQ